MRKNKTIYSTESKRLLSWMAVQRDAADLSIRALADQLGWPSSIVGKIFTGDRRIDVLEYLQVCQAIHADPHEGLDLVLKPAIKKKAR